jgi:hypothetical protein
MVETAVADLCRSLPNWVRRETEICDSIKAYRGDATANPEGTGDFVSFFLARPQPHD